MARSGWAGGPTADWPSGLRRHGTASPGHSHDASRSDSLIIYARADPAVGGRILQVLTVQRAEIQRFTMDFSSFDHHEVKGIESIQEPLMRVSLVMAWHGDDQTDRMVKRLDRLIDVYEVERSQA